MSWIKRNLYFVIGTLVALGLMGYGGFRLYSSFTNEKEVSDKIQAQYTELDRLKKQNPHPGSSGAGKVDNVKAAKDQEAMLRDYLAKTRLAFVRPTPIPDTPKVSDKEFKTELSTTTAQLTREAKEASVALPADYYFTFEAQRKVLQFDAGSLEKLATHLGEIKAICDVLFAAKINSLVAMQREVISAMDQNASDYLAEKTMSTPLGDLTPYRVVFQCFSAELAQVLGGLANSPHGFIVKAINVEPAEVAADTADPGASGPAAMNQAQIDSMKMRYRYNRGGDSGRYTPPPRVAAPVATAPTANKPTVLINEHQVKVTLLIEVVKLKAETAPVKPEQGKTNVVTK